MSDIVSQQTDQYLTFSLGEDHYAIEVSNVKEVLELQSITRVPKTPDFMRGVINVRGGVVPVLDLRRKFDMQAVDPTVDTCIVVMEVAMGEETVTIGGIVDKVEEVAEIPSEEIEPPPNIGTQQNYNFIEGIAKYNDTFFIILNSQKILTEGELQRVTEAGGGEENNT